MATDEDVKQMGRVTVEAINEQWRRKGEKAARTYVAGLVYGVADWLTVTDGMRGTYNWFQQFADELATRRPDMPK